MKTFTKTRLALALACMAPLAAQATDGYFANGYGMKANGMGGAAVAVARTSVSFSTLPK